MKLGKYLLFLSDESPAFSPGDSIVLRDSSPPPFWVITLLEEHLPLLPNYSNYVLSFWMTWHEYAEVGSTGFNQQFHTNSENEWR